MSTVASKYENLIYAIRLHRNARAFAEAAVELAKSRSAPELTFAAIHLASALELILKARLAVEDHQHLVSKGKVATILQFEEGDFKSIATDECVEKLRTLNIFALNRSQEIGLALVRRLRNRAVHYIAPTESELKAALGAGLNLFIDIHRSQFSHWDATDNCLPIDDMLLELRDVEGFVAARLGTLKQKLATMQRPRTHYFDECWCCAQDTVVIDGDYFLCVFCGAENEIGCEVEGKSRDREVQKCPECGRRSFATRTWFPEDFTQECFCCGFCIGEEPRWLDWRTGQEIPRLHALDRMLEEQVNASIYPECVEGLNRGCNTERV